MTSRTATAPRPVPAPDDPVPARMPDRGDARSGGRDGASRTTSAPPPQSPPQPRPPALLAPLLALALALPLLLAFNEPPSATFYNQAAALVGWGLAVAVLARWLPPRDLIYRQGLNLLLAALALLVLAALVAPSWAALPWGMALSAAAVISAAGVAAAAGAASSQARHTALVFGAIAAGVLIAAAGNAVVAFVQIFMPRLADGVLVAATAIEGRAAGNLRQPNQLATLTLWAIAVTAWLADRRLRRLAREQAYAPTLMDSRTRRHRAVAVPGWTQRADLHVAALLFVVVAVFTAVLVLTGSRTGAIGLVVVAAWAGVDRRLAPAVRWVLLAAPLVMLLQWWALLANVAALQPDAGSGDRVASAAGDPRWVIWRQTLALIGQHPWTGVGFGEFNFAWTLTPFVERPGQHFFDHAHSLPLHLAAELGVPLALLVTGLLAVALWRAGRAAWRHEGELGVTLRCAFVMLLVMALHSLTEYPLWYAHLLLPTAFVFGLCLAGHERRSTLQRAWLADHRPVRTLLLAAVTGTGLSLAALWDYHRVVAIFAPSADAAPLAERIADGRRSWFFGHHADYAAVTTADRPSALMPAFDRAAHHLLDTRLMMAWARAMDETNQNDRARHLAQRLAEFRHPQAAEFFAPCARFSEAEIARASEPPPVLSVPVQRVVAPAAAIADAGLPMAVPTVAPPAAVPPGGAPGPAASGPAQPGTAAAMPATPPVVPSSALPKGPAPPADPAFTPPPPLDVPFQCLRPVRALTYLDFR